MTEPRRTVVVLHGLGLSAQMAEPLRALLEPDLRVVAVDLPGHGDAPDAEGDGVDAIADAVLARIADAADGSPFLLVGHSMGGKIATLIAARTLAGQTPLFGLAGLVLLAPSPPTPEPIDDERRASMLAWAEDGPISAAHAREFVDANVASPLAAPLDALAIADVERTSPLAWTRWLTTGSTEDVSAEVGALDVPAIVLAGADDADLGAAAQPRLLGHVLPRARFVRLDGTGHLVALEQPDAVASAIRDVWSEVAAAPTVPAPWAVLIASSRVDVEERGILARRAIVDDPASEPQALSAVQLETLRALADLVVPQDGGGRIDLAARVDRALAAGEGDGWRPAVLPPDVEAYRAALDDLARAWPDEDDGRRAMLTAIADGDDGPFDGARLDAAQRTAWFDDARNDLVRAWMAHPATLARIGYDGFALGGTGAEPVGYVELDADLRESWEPEELGALR